MTWAATAAITAIVSATGGIVEARNQKSDAKNKEQSANSEINKKKRLAAAASRETAQGGITSTLGGGTLGSN